MLLKRVPPLLSAPLKMSPGSPAGFLNPKPSTPAGFPPAAKLIAEGEGGGLAKLVGLLSSGVDSVIHPCAFALQNLIEASNDWSKALLDAGILPPLLLLNETADKKKPWGEPVRACLDALAAAMGTPKDAREAAQRTDLGAWLVVPQAS